VIPDLFEAFRKLGIGAAFVSLVLAALLTAAVFLAQSMASWFDDRNS
jgi:hypothetical protein